MTNLRPATKPKQFIKTYRLTFSQSLVQMGINAIALAMVIGIVPSISATSLLSVLVATFLLATINWLIQPTLHFFARLFGIAGLLIMSIFSNAIVMGLVFWLMPQIQTNNYWAIFWASWLYAIILSLANWVLVSRSQDVFLADILRRTKINPEAQTDKKGFVFVQLDGVSAPVLDWQIKAGNMPNISRLLREEGYTFDTWRTQIPSTTPASQAGILLGSCENIPAFRWYEKDTGKMVVANQFDGAALIESRLSTGNGLLADGGVSIGNLFSGNAPTNVMVMSKAGGDRESIHNVNDYVSFFTTPLGFMRALVLSVGEMAKEIFQARRAEAKDILPRIHRGGSYILLRAATNVLMRDMQTSMVIKNMQLGVNSVYVDFLDYDEIAHHAGLARPESLASLSGLDEVVGMLMRAREYAARQYEIVLLSDHGQSQGPTFEQLNGGVNLESLVLNLLGVAKSTVVDEKAPAEDRSAVSNLLAHEAGGQGRVGRLARSLQAKLNASKTYGVQAETKAEPHPAVVTGSGNLGNIWLTVYNERATIEEIERDYPELLKGLLGSRGIGFVIVQTKDIGPVCVSSEGSIQLESDVVSGKSPLGGYPEYTREDLLHLAVMKPAPDIIVLSSYDHDRDEVFAFEGLVGNHGGLGGWQTEAVLLHPSKYGIDARHISHGRIRGAHTVHRILVDWLQQEGQHTNQ